MTTPLHDHGSTHATDGGSPAARTAQARAAGVLYLVIIVLGLFTEVAVRAGLVVPGDPGATAAALLASPWLVRAGFAANLTYLLCEVAMTVLLYLLLKPVSAALSLVAAAFRLTSLAVYAVSLLAMFSALLILERNLGAEPDVLAATHLDLSAYGFTLGLIFFGVNCLAMARLLVRSPRAPKPMGVLLGVAGLGYLTSGGLYFLLPGYHGSLTVPLVAPALVAEVWLCVWLLRGRV
ncbi:DUF4386 domain-containing protein [Sphaerisporangium sp. B11E5]|uniref:DUF4386 domain-containing protein n=1 Tax=Sphaerisporangium sp. B11E5 TaxID=3153563 RepID=UPI00325C8686